jgi:hypothetical protein
MDGPRYTHSNRRPRLVAAEPQHLRGSLSRGGVTAIPRGWTFDEIDSRNWRIVPYLAGRAGLGNIDAKEPKSVQCAQGQDFTLTLNMGSGVR